jgi:Transposase.
MMQQVYDEDALSLRQDRSKGKVMFGQYFDFTGIFHVEFIPEGSTVNKTRYKELWFTKNWLLLHDNAPDHLSLSFY